MPFSFRVNQLLAAFAGLALTAFHLERAPGVDPLNLEDRRTLAGGPEVVRPGTQPVVRSNDPFADKYEQFDFDREIETPVETKEEPVDFDPTNVEDRRAVAGRPEVARPGTARVELPDDPFAEKNERFGLDDEVVLSEGSSLEKPAPQEGTPPPGEEDQISKNIKEHEANVAALEELRKWRDEQLAGVTNQRDRQRIEKEYLDLVNQVQQGRREEVLDEIGVTGINTFATPEPGNQSSTASLLSIPTEGQFKITDDLLLPQEELQNNLDSIVNEASEYGLDSNELAYVLATAHWESKLGGDIIERYEGDDSNAYFQERYWDNIDVRNQLGNQFRSDAWTFIGRGFVQLTGRGNYQYFSELFAEDILSDPNRLLRDPELAARILVHGMTEGTYTGLSINEQNGKLDITLIDEEERNKLSDYNFPEDFVLARDIIGSGAEQEIADIAQAYACALEELCKAGMLPEGIVCADAKCP